MYVPSFDDAHDRAHAHVNAMVPRRPKAIAQASAPPLNRPRIQNRSRPRWTSTESSDESWYPAKRQLSEAVVETHHMTLGINERTARQDEPPFSPVPSTFAALHQIGRQDDFFRIRLDR